MAGVWVATMKRGRGRCPHAARCIAALNAPALRSARLGSPRRASERACRHASTRHSRIVLPVPENALSRRAASKLFSDRAEAGRCRPPTGVPPALPPAAADMPPAPDADAPNDWSPSGVAPPPPPPLATPPLADAAPSIGDALGDVERKVPPMTDASGVHTLASHPPDMDALRPSSGAPTERPPLAPIALEL